MGVKRGYFLNDDNEKIVVTFVGDKVVDDSDVVFGASPVVLTMKGEPSAFTPVKYTLGTVTIIAERGEFLDLMTTNVLDVRVRIVNETTGEVLFLGCVSPNTFSQDFSSRLNEFSVEIVDYLGATKHLNYPFDGGLRVRTLRELTTRIMQRFFPEINELCVPYTMRLMPGESYEHNLEDGTPRYMEMSVSERALVDDVDPYSPQLSEGVAGALRFPAEDVPCYDVLEKIADSLLFSFVQVGSRWELVDDVQTVAHSSKAYISYSTDDEWATYTERKEEQKEKATYDVDVSDYASPSFSYSSAQKFRRFSIKNTYEERVRCYPSLFSEGLLEASGKTNYLPENKIQWQEIASLCYDLLQPANDEYGYFRGARLTAEADLDEQYYIERPAALFSDALDWKKTLMLYNPIDLKASPVLMQKKAAFPVEIAARSGVGVYIKFRAGVAAGYIKIRPGGFLDKGEGLVRILFASVNVGNHSYTAVPTADAGGREVYWEEYLGDYRNSVAINVNGQATDKWAWVREFSESFDYALGYVQAVRDLNEWNSDTPVGGALEVKIFPGPNPLSGVGDTIVVDEFEVGTCAAYENLRTFSALHLKAPIVYNDEAVADGEYPEHELPFDVCFAHSKGYMSPYIGGVNYAAKVRVNVEDSGQFSTGFRSHLAYFGNCDDDRSHYGNSVRRLAKLVNLGNSYTTEVSVFDTSRKGIAPYTKVVIDGKAYRVVSFEKDLKTNTTNILIL